jgi:anaerobic selenocysteine-containing dehydrogenase
MPGPEIILTTCPRDCYDSCGIAVLTRDGAIIRVRGDRNSPVNRGALCGKCTLAYNGILQDPAHRLQRPQKRVGPKGSGRFAPISWAEAVTTIAAELHRISATAGPHTVAYAHYTGTISKIAYAFPVRFFNRLGATEVEPDTICNMAGHVALQYTLGSSLIGFDPRTARDAHSIVVWGANPSTSAPHAHKHWFREAPGKKIVVDPVRHETARAADLHLQLAPGSDAALAFALLHVLRREGGINRRFVAQHVLGWDEIDPLLDGCTPDWAEQVTEVPAAAIEEAALTIGPQAKVREPLGESVPNQEIFRRLARAMGYEDPELYETDEAILDHLLGGASSVRGFEELKRRGTVFVSAEPVVQFAGLEFPTPSGRIELASARAEADGHPRVPQPVSDPRPAPGRLRLLSPASAWLMNFSFANEAEIERRLGAADIVLNPSDAAASRLQEGDLARISNETGEIVLPVRISDDVRPGVALSYKGRWPRREPARVNVNALNPGGKADFGESTCVHGVEVTIAPLAAPG